MATSETDELFYRDFKHVINYLETQKQLMDAHMVDFFTSNHWETLLPRNIREDLESLPQQQFTSLPNASTDSKDFERFGENLKKFLKEAGQAQLRSFSWVKDQEEFTSENRVDFISHIMTPKKSYEVDVMSDVINRLVKQFQVSKILDLGSGKGYLSQHLALQYGLNVIGVDSSESNTQNAAKRNERLLKAWKGLTKKSQREKVDASSNLAEGNVTSDHLDSQPLGRLLDVHVGNTKDDNSESLPNCCNHITCRISHVCSHDDNNLDISGLNEASHFDEVKASHFLCNPMQSTVEAESKQPIVSKVDIAESKHSAGGTHQSQLVAEVSSQETFLQLSSVPSLNSEHHDSVTHCDKQCRNLHMISGKITDSKHASTTVNSKSQQSQTANPASFVPITGFVDQSFVAHGGLTRFFDELGATNGVTTGCDGMFIVGLHTCGDLAPAALQIFVTEASVRVICIVGCCYHLVSQEVGGSDDDADNPGFPMSQFLKPFRLHITRNATMVAQQAADRIAVKSKCPPPSVLYRAILQVILREKFDLDGRGIHVGKAGAKCKDFKEYVHKCLKKLGLEDRINEFSDGEVESYLERFISQEKQLHAFHQLRAAIAPCIESVFLLDRLCYVYEQGYKSACIVRLFDPVKSPRCYAIIANKT